MVGVDKMEHGPLEGKPGTPRKPVDLDTILIEDVGQFGRYQITTLMLASLPIMFGALCTGEYIFTTARTPTRCVIPECDRPVPEFLPVWLENAIPRTDSGDFDNCARFVNNSVNHTDDTCPAWLFNTSRIQKCEEYVYENNNSIVYDFKMACDEWRRSLIGSVRTLGSFLVLPITGFVSDRWGRRAALTINVVNTAWVGLVRSFVNSYEWFLALEFIESAIGGGSFPSCYILVTELVGPTYRGRAGGVVFTMFALGEMFLGLMAWGVQSWRSLTRVIYAPQLLFVCYFWILSESVRWLMSKGHYEESEQILKRVAKANKKELSPKSLEALRATAEAKKNMVKPKEPWLPVLVIRSKTILSRCCVSPIWWVTNTLVYYGMNINSVNLVGNSYLNYVAVAAVEIPGYWTAILLLESVGRKPVLICGYWLCAICQFAFAFLPEGFDWLSVVLYLIAKYCISVVVYSTYTYTAELYPTKYRQSLVAFSSTIGRLGSISAAITPSLATEIWGPLPSVLFGMFALLSGAVTFTTPETIGTRLPDTIEEAELLKYNRKSTKKHQMY